MNVSPKKMGSSGTISEGTYKLLCEGLSSLIPINGMNARYGDNSRKKLMTMLVKTMDIESSEAGKLLYRLLRDTAQDIHAEKLNCAEDHRVRWTTYQNLKLWFDSCEKFLVEFGFATYDADGELVIDAQHGRNMHISRREQRESGRPSDCHLLRHSFSSARKSDVEISAHDDDDQRTHLSGRTDFPPLSISDGGANQRSRSGPRRDHSVHA